MDAEAVQAQIPKKAVRSLKARLQVVKKHLEPLLSKPLNEIYTKLPLEERYELQVMLSYSLNTLYYIYLRTQGSDPQKHEVMDELVRVQKYVQKLKKFQGKEPKPSMRVDKGAASRFIKAAINESKGAPESNVDRKRPAEEIDSDSSSSSSEEEGQVKDKKKKMDPFSKRSKSTQQNNKKKKKMNK